MADVRCNGLAVANPSSLCFPRIGAWTADVVVDTDSELAADATITVGDALALVGHVARQEAKHGVVRARIVGGHGGLGKLVTPKHYTRPTLAVVLKDVLADAGEVLASDADAAALSTQLEHWTSVPIPAGKAIETLVAHAPAGTVWRVKPDGTIWLGVDAFPDAGLDDIRDQQRSGADGSVELGLDLPTLLPGVSIEGRKVDYVEHKLGDPDIHTFVWFQDEGGSNARERMREAFAANVRGAMPTPLYETLYPSKLVKQSADLTLVDVVPQNANLPPMANIPLRVGVPGLTVQVSPGAFVLIGWEEGDPARPYACIWQIGANVLALNFATLQSRLGDPDASQPMVLGTAFEAIWIAHTHPTPFGPTGPTPMPLKPALSIKHKLDS